MLSRARRHTKLPDLSLSVGFLAKKRIECLLAQMMTAKQQREPHSGSRVLAEVEIWLTGQLRFITLLELGSGIDDGLAFDVDDRGVLLPNEIAVSSCVNMMGIEMKAHRFTDTITEHDDGIRQSAGILLELLEMISSHSTHVGDGFLSTLLKTV